MYTNLPMYVCTRVPIVYLIKFILNHKGDSFFAIQKQDYCILCYSVKYFIVSFFFKNYNNKWKSFRFGFLRESSKIKF